MWVLIVLGTDDMAACTVEGALVGCYYDCSGHCGRDCGGVVE